MDLRGHWSKNQCPSGQEVKLRGSWNPPCVHVPSPVSRISRHQPHPGCCWQTSHPGSWQFSAARGERPNRQRENSNQWDISYGHLQTAWQCIAYRSLSPSLIQLSTICLFLALHKHLKHSWKNCSKHSVCKTAFLDCIAHDFVDFSWFFFLPGGHTCYTLRWLQNGGTLFNFFELCFEQRNKRLARNQINHMYTKWH